MSPDLTTRFAGLNWHRIPAGSPRHCWLTAVEYPPDEVTPICRSLSLCPAAKLTLGNDCPFPADAWKPADAVGTTVPYAIWEVVPICPVIENTWVGSNAEPMVKLKV